MKGDGESMSLVPDVPQQKKRRRIRRKADGRGGPGEKNLFFPLRQRGHRKAFDFQPLQRFESGGDLAFPPINKDQVGERFFLQLQPAVAPTHHLRHGLKIVDPGNAADDEFAVARFIGPAPVEADHRGDRLHSLKVRDVKGFDAFRGPRQMEMPHQVLNGAAGLEPFRQHLRRHFAKGHALPHVLHRFDTVPNLGRRFIFHFFGQASHFLFPLRRHFFMPPLEEPPRSVGHSLVFAGGDFSDARGGAFAGVQVEAGADLLIRERMALLNFEFAGPERKQFFPPGPAQVLSHPAHVGIGSEIDRAVPPFLPGEKKPGEVLAQGEGDVRIGLVVSPHGIEGRLMPADEAPLQHESLPFAGGGDVIHVPDGGGESLVLGFLGGVPVSGSSEIAGHSFLQVAGLSDVDDLPGGIAHEIDAGRVRKPGKSEGLSHGR